MPKILLDPAGVNSIRSIVERQAYEIQDIGQRVSQVAASLDIEVASTENIKQSLSTLNRNCQANKAKLDGMTAALDRVNSEFMRTDRQITNQAKELEYRMDHAGRVNVIGSTTIPLLALTAVDAVNSLFGITDEGYSTIESAMLSIRRFLDSQAERNGLVSAEGEALYQYLQENDPTFLFGRYDFSIQFMNDLEGFDAYLFCLKNWKHAFASMFFGGGSVEGVAEAFLNNPDECKAILRNVIDDICQTDYLDVLSGDQEKYLGIIKDLAEIGGFDDSVAMIDELNSWIGDIETADKILKDYSANIAMLESLKNLAPGSTTLSSVIDDLISEYRNQAGAMLFDDLKGKAEEGVMDIASYALGLNIGGADTIIQGVLSDVPELDAINTVLYSSDMKSTAIRSFQTAASKIRSGDFTAEDMTAYRNSFNLARSLTLQEYEAMLTYYDEGTKQASYLRNQIKQLESMTFDNFNYATAYSNYSTFSSGAGYGGGGGGGGGFR